MNKFKCKHCGSNTNMILIMEGFKGCNECMKCLGDKYKNKKVRELELL